MEKIGILTLHGYANFGNRFQNYAVSRIVEKFGFQPETIAVYPNYKQLVRPALNFLKSLSGDVKAKRYMKMYRFSKKYIPTRLIVRADRRVPGSISGEYAYFITGSDQVWNPSIRIDERDNFFLSFAKKNQRVCISPSFGVDSLDEKYSDSYRKGLSGFNLLCSREKAGIDIIRAVASRNAELLIDPTLALTKQEWMTVASPCKDAPSDYILVAMLGSLSDDKREYLNALAKRENAGIVDVFAEGSAYGPDEVLSLIDAAKLVFTDSFHFTAFSVNFGTPFIVCRREADSVNSATFSRIDSLMDMFSLKERIYPNVPDGCELICDFGSAEKALEAQREKFYDFVRRSLNYHNEG